MNQVVISWCNQAKYIDILENARFNIKSFSAKYLVHMRFKMHYTNDLRRVIFFPYPCDDDTILRKKG